MTNELKAIEQKTVTINDEQLIAVKANDGHIYVSISEMCHSLGIDPQSQRRRINRQTVLEEGMKGVANLTTPGGEQSAYVLRIDLVPLWLSGIRTKTVNEDARPTLEAFQRKAARVLYEAFAENKVTAAHDDELMQSQSPAAIAYRHAMAIAQISRQQYYLEKRMDEREQLVNANITELNQRLSLVEANMSDPNAFVTEKQAQQIAGAVKTVALGMADKYGGNHFGRIYNELYKRYDITGYKRLPATKFNDAMQWLRGWWGEISNDDVPF